MSADVAYDVRTGRLTKDVEVKDLNGSFLLSGSFASNRSFKKGDEWHEEASYFNYKLFVKSQKQIDYYTKYLKKGAQITIDGVINQEHWEKDGQKQSAYVFYANRIIPAFISKSGGENSGSSGVPSYDPSEGFPEDPVF